MHLLLGWGYAQRREHEKACVEVRIADSLLDYERRPEGRFDDPSLRLVAAALWSACSDWEEARVDLRAAARLDPSLTWARQLADRDTPPAELFMVFGGTGPEPYWDPELGPSLLRAGRRMGFRYSGQKSTAELIDGADRRYPLRRSPDASAWYERHLLRNNAIQDLIADSHFGKDVATEGIVAGGKIGAATLLGAAWIAGGIVLGSGIAYLGLEGGSGEVVALGLVVAAAGTEQGVKTIQEGARESSRAFTERVDPSTRYRLVRFLPEYIWMGWSDTKITPPLAVRGQSGASAPVSFGKDSRVTFLYFPDVPYATHRRSSY
jgi:hypothetical protein